MLTKELKTVLSLALGLILLIRISPAVSAYQNPSADTGAPTQAAPQSQSELRALVAPIALYPDNLVAEVLAAATFPDQVAVASYWLQSNKNLSGNALTQAVGKQSWNDSVKALIAFPSVLANMAKNLAWTSQLGEAYHTQKSEVMAAIQALRAQAKAAGNLKSTPQMSVQQQTPQTIVIEPANPQVVYVPEYNPALVYGYPYVTPGYSAADVAATAAISFGAGLALGAWADSAWGWHGWGCDWAGGAVAYHGAAFYGNPAWHGAYHPYGFDGAYHPYGYSGAYHPYANANRQYNRNEFNRNVSGNTVNVNRGGVQNFSNNHFSDANSWANHNNFAAKSNAFTGLSGHAGGFDSGHFGGSEGGHFGGFGDEHSGGFGGGHFGGFGGWSSRADSARGWGSMRAGGFGGFHGGFGGFHGGGRR
jgi:Protein of unknown function (DUF3300)